MTQKRRWNYSLILEYNKPFTLQSQSE